MKKVWVVGLAVLTSASGLAAPVTFRDLNGRPVTPLENPHSSAVVLLFICHDCPISNAYAPELNRIYKAYHTKKVTFYAIYTEPDTPISVERQHARAFGYQFPGLADPTNKLAHQVGATVTPEAVVLSGDGKVLYRGRIDDTYPSIGVRRQQAGVHDLRRALDQVLSGKPVVPSKTEAVGCFIPMS